jgi:hypothetical protein
MHYESQLIVSYSVWIFFMHVMWGLTGGGGNWKKAKLQPYIVKQMPKIYRHYRKERRENVHMEV